MKFFVWNQYFLILLPLFDGVDKNANIFRSNEYYDLKLSKNFDEWVAFLLTLLNLISFFTLTLRVAHAKNGLFNWVSLTITFKI